MWLLLLMGANHAQAGDPTPSPLYFVTHNGLQIFGPGFRTPEAAGAYIEAEHFKFVWEAGLHCSAFVQRFNATDFFEEAIPNRASTNTVDKSAIRQWGMCVESIPQTQTCKTYACIPDPTTYQYHMRADCGSSALVFNRNGGRPRCECELANSQWVQRLNTCVPVKHIVSTPPNNFCVGNPIYPLTGTKREEIATNLSLGGLALNLVYDTTPAVPVNDGGTRLALSKPMSAGPLWSTALHRRVLVYGAGGGALVERGDGRTVSFIGDGTGNYTPTADTNDRLRIMAGGYRYTDAKNSSQETYDSAGNLTGLFTSTGSSIALTYSGATTTLAVAPAPGYLIQAQDDRGRIVNFTYQLPSGASPSAGGVIAQISSNTGSSIALAYDSAGNLATLSWANGRVRTLLYENPALPWALTGIIDESLIRSATYTYDSAGRATSTESAGGINKYAATYTSPPGLFVYDVMEINPQLIYRYHTWAAPQGLQLSAPLGSSSAVDAASVLGRSLLASQSQPAGSGCAPSTSATAYDANGNRASQDDFTGRRVCYANDLSRNLETVRVEGLANTQACTAVTALGAALPAGSRKVSTDWHTDWRLPRRVAEPGRRTTLVYNGQPDPFSGNSLPTSCAPASAALPDGKPLAVLCRQVEQATTDADGSQGFNAGLQAGASARDQRWTYNQRGQVLSHDGPRTDVADLTSYTYYADTAFNAADQSAVGHTLGDLQSMTNAAGQTTTYGLYNRQGQLVQMTDPNGVSTTNVYDLRQRLVSTTTAGLTTSYTYDAVGQLVRSTRPDGSYTGYAYDAAHRQVAVFDNLGNRIDYTLDNAGNRVAENVKDPGGTLRWRLTRSIDALGRVQQAIGRSSFTWVYDQTGAGFSNGIGRLTSTTHAGGFERYAYDALGRLVSQTTADSQSGAARTSTYEYDAAGNVTALTYPSGRKLFITYANGQPSAMSLSPTANAAPALLVSGIQWQPFGPIRSWQWAMNSGARLHERGFDVHGRIVRYPLGNLVRDLSYDAADRIASYTHFNPSNGAPVPAANQSFAYDELGRLTGVATTGWNSAFGYDANGNRTAAALNGVANAYATDTASNRLLSVSNPARGFGYDAAGNVVSEAAPADPQSLPLAATYDASNRLDAVTSSAGLTSYTYNVHGLRVAKTTVGMSILNCVPGPGGKSICAQPMQPAPVMTQFAYDQQGRVLGEYNDFGQVTQEFIWLGDTPIAVVGPEWVNGGVSTVAYYIHADHLDTPRHIVDRAGNIRWSWDAEPFGAPLPNESPAGLVAFKFNLRFPGQYFDAESGKHYNTFRDYDASVGRYTQSDPIGLAGGINTYSYVGGNPISRVDPIGLLDRLVFDGRTLTGYEDFGVEFRVPAVSGPYGLGKLPEGVYMGRNLRQRNEKGNKAMQCEGKGWSLDLDPTFSTTRDLLRIHPDGNVPGTEGCIGPSCGANQQTVYDALRGYFREGWTSIPVIVRYPK